MLVAELAQAPEELVRAHRHAALALHGLEHDRGGLIVDQVGEALDAVDLAGGEAGHARAEAFLDFSCGIALRSL